MIVSCTSCRAKFRLDPARVLGDWAPLICPKCRTRFVVTIREHPSGGTLGVALVAAPDSEARTALMRVLREEGLAVKTVDRADAGCHYLTLCAPDLLLVAPRLAQGEGVELCEMVRNSAELRNCRILLALDPRDDGDQWKRSMPVENALRLTASLDDLRRDLADCLATLRRRREELSAYTRELRRAERLARTILSDIILYNPEEVEKGIADDTFHDLLSEELEDARRYYAEHVHPDVLGRTNLFEDLLEKYLADRKRQLDANLPDSPR